MSLMHYQLAGSVFQTPVLSPFFPQSIMFTSFMEEDGGCLLSSKCYHSHVFSHIKLLPRAECPLLMWQTGILTSIAFKTHTIRMEQSTLDISHILWHHLPMAYNKYPPPSGVELCCRGREGCDPDRSDTREAMKQTTTTKELYKSRVSVGSTCFHVSGWAFST